MELEDIKDAFNTEILYIFYILAENCIEGVSSTEFEDTMRQRTLEKLIKDGYVKKRFINVSKKTKTIKYSLTDEGISYLNRVMNTLKKEYKPKK